MEKTDLERREREEEQIELHFETLEARCLSDRSKQVCAKICLTIGLVQTEIITHALLEGTDRVALGCISDYKRRSDVSNCVCNWVIDIRNQSGSKTFEW